MHLIHHWTLTRKSNSPKATTFVKMMQFYDKSWRIKNASASNWIELFFRHDPKLIVLRHKWEMLVGSPVLMKWFNFNVESELYEKFLQDIFDLFYVFMGVEAILKLKSFCLMIDWLTFTVSMSYYFLTEAFFVRRKRRDHLNSSYEC